MFHCLHAAITTNVLIIGRFVTFCRAAYPALGCVRETDRGAQE